MLVDGSSGTEFPAAVVKGYKDLKDEEMGAFQNPTQLGIRKLQLYSLLTVCVIVITAEF